MSHIRTLRVGMPILGFLVAGGGVVSAGELTVVSVEPMARSLEAPVDTSITVRFDRPVDRDSVIDGQSFTAFGRWSGSVAGTFHFTDDDQTVILLPDQVFSAGEAVMVILSHDLQAADGSFLRSAGYSFQFWTQARSADMDFVEIAVMSTRTTPGETTQSYGGIATDLNGDRFCDITIVNEDTGDLRVFLNLADRSGLYEDFIEPTFPVNDRASPSEPADFNRDGIPDICVANINTGTVSILLGVGDGTFHPQQEVAVGAGPRGIAVLDVDGDGDVDIVNTNSVSSNLSILLNDGSGVFGPATFFEGGSSGEWALAAADMNEDGILDLVIGANSGQRIIVSLGNGDGTFTIASIQSSGGSTWMLNCGDVNGDGHEDVAAVNSFSNNGAILIGDGRGGLASPQTYSLDPFALATDLGDLDGDGDLDWVTSSFNGDWRIFTNDGLGNFTFFQEINATIAASCALLFDFDNDGDLDMGLIDELADVVVLMKNSGTAPVLGDFNDDCHIDLSDYAAFQDCLSGPGVCADPGCAVMDFEDDCDVDLDDFARFQRAFTGSMAFPPGCDQE
ncbi:MAG: VCBS repeat-containing protein [Planctomycetes bacterium]|nr:VCBS repeat-containing protein [Planctomycetota bacterium]